MNLRLHLSLVIALCMTISLQAQIDSTVQEYIPTEEAPAMAAFKLKPRLGIGIGSLMFIGDMGRDNRGYHPGSADMAYTLDITNELTSYLDARLYTMFGTIHIDENTDPRRLNMQSQIRSGGFSLSYNFGNFLPRNRMAEPFISAGIEAFEFLSKTDLYDAQGNMYNYWDDGTIRSIDQSAENASDAIMLQRDYVYETDLRNQNLDGLGPYRERSIAIPVGVGVQFYMTDRFRGRLGTSYHFTMTDNVDNLSSNSTGVRKGDAKNDRFLFSSFSLNYDLNPMRSRQPGIPGEFLDENGNLLVVLEDTDMDGVPDYADRCWGTPEGVAVDEKGCPIDTDGDGFADYIDDEPNSPHTYVDGNGVAMADEDIYDHHMMWHDSIPWIGESRMLEEYAQLNSDMSRAAEAEYRVRILREGEGLSQEQINQLLAIDDIQAVEENGEKVFVTGTYDHLPDAIKKKIELQQDGIEASVVLGTNQDGFALVIGTTEMEDEMTEQVLAERALMENETNNTVKYRVQIGAFRYALSENIFKDVPDVLNILGSDGLTRYVTRPYTTVNDAALRKINLLLEGFEGAFITAYRGGERITIEEAKSGVIADKPEVVADVENKEAIDTSKISYKVLIASFEGQVPVDIMYQLLEFGNAVPHREANGTTNVYSKPVKSLMEAETVLALVHEYGFSEANIVGDFNGSTVSLAEIQNMLNQTTPQVTLTE
ncbi:MAG: hypothetical protein GC193_02155 [Cryomorphaceae bacterium]|nr:hypothetical protein [Cryomorphaceae bacterium]